MTAPFTVEAPPADASLDASLEPFAAFLANPQVTDIFVNGQGGLYVDAGRGAYREPHWRASEREIRELAIALIGAGGRHIDDAHPCVDVRLRGGIRVHAILSPVATTGTAISLRRQRWDRPTLEDLAARGMFSAELLHQLRDVVDRRTNFLVSGATGAGKTTLLAALLGESRQSERIVSIEDVAELRLDHAHHVALEARQANLEGAGAVSLASLVREALRMKPDRLIVGECRGAEVRELLSALNTGHDGGAGTVHANGIDDVPSRLEALGALAGLDDRALARQVLSAIDLVIHVASDANGVRRISAMGRFVERDGRLGIASDDPIAPVPQQASPGITDHAHGEHQMREEQRAHEEQQAPMLASPMRYGTPPLPVPEPDRAAAVTPEHTLARNSGRFVPIQRPRAAERTS